MFGYVWPNIVIKTLQETYNTLLYAIADATIKSNWLSLTELANASGNNDYENDNFQQTFDFHNLKKFEKIIEENFRKNIGTKHIES